MRRKDAPRVVGFDFGTAPAPAPVSAPAPAPAPPPVAAPPPVPLTSAPAPEWAPPPAPVLTAPEPAWGVTAPGYGMPGPLTWQPPPQKKTRRAPLFAALVGMLVVAAPLMSRVVSAVTPPLHTPASVGGYARIHSAQIDATERDMREHMTDIRKLIVGTYGSGQVPHYLLIAGDGAERTSAQSFANFKKGFTKSGAATMGEPNTVDDDTVCATVQIGRLPGVACVWGGGRSDGAVLALGDRQIERVAQVTAAARTAVNGS